MTISALWLFARDAAATDTWTTPHPGVDLLYRTTGSQRIHAAYVDLCAPGISVRTTRPDERGQTVSAFANDIDADLVINGDLFSSGFTPSGLAMGGGTLWSDAPDNTWEASAVFGAEQAEITQTSRELSSFQDWTTEIVSGRPVILDEGIPLASTSDPICVTNPRSGVGLSADRKTMVMVVVDGRQSGADGMDCEDFGDLMLELGAHDALNFDGGGSTAMYVRGQGIVNDPSDGSERVVANHLAVFADGVSPPSSCDRTWDESVLQSHRRDTRGATDVDGDGVADPCGREGAAVTCGSGATPIVGPPLSDTSGQGDLDNTTTLRAADVTGDGLADLCARDDTLGFQCWPSLGNGFGAPFGGPAMTDADGWDEPQQYTTIRMADVDGDGRDDVCGKASGVWRCWPSLGTGFGAPFDGPALEGGWDHVRRFGSFRTGDTDGDGRDDLCAITGSRVACWRSLGTSFADVTDGPAWTDGDGWDDVRRQSTFTLADVNGDGRDDVCGRTAAGYTCHLSDGVGFGEATPLADTADGAGFTDHAAYATLRLGDLDDDGDLDLCGRGSAGVQCWPWEGGAFGVAFSGPVLGAAFDRPEHYATLRMADVTGDGRADLCGRDTDGVWCWPSVDGGFGAPVAGPAWTDAAGWSEPASYATIRLGGQWEARVPTGEGGTSPPTVPGTDDPEVPTDAVPGEGYDREGLRSGGCGCTHGGAGGWLVVGAVFFGARRRSPLTPTAR